MAALAGFRAPGIKVFRLLFLQKKTFLPAPPGLP
jgi:hypothetical protein